MNASIPVKKQKIIEFRQVPVIDRFGGEKMIYARSIKGRLLLERSEFISYIESEATTKRLVHLNLLTSYYSNGTKKKRKNGRLDNRETWYCLYEWSRIDFNNLHHKTGVK